jgi:hypothetical protein
MEVGRGKWGPSTLLMGEGRGCPGNAWHGRCGVQSVRLRTSARRPAGRRAGMWAAAAVGSAQ